MGGLLVIFFWLNQDMTIWQCSRAWVPAGIKVSKYGVLRAHLFLWRRQAYWCIFLIKTPTPRHTWLDSQILSTRAYDSNVTFTLNWMQWLFICRCALLNRRGQNWRYCRCDIHYNLGPFRSWIHWNSCMPVSNRIK